MSEKIKITVVMDDEKQTRILVTQDPFVTLLPVLLENQLLTDSLCGGRGECGGCTVQFLDGATMPTAMERKRFSPEELRQGYRLACTAKPRTDCVVRLPRHEGANVPVLTKTIPLSENIDSISQEKSQSENRISDVTKSTKDGLKISNVILTNQSGDMDCMIAVDLGTTTIAMQLMSLAAGEVLDTYCEHNPQRRYGADVLSRIQASCTGHREELQRLVCETLLRGVKRFLTSGKARLCGMCVAGNTAMEHLLMGYDVQSLGRSPFTPVEIGVQETTLSALFACLADDTGLLSGLSADSVTALGTLPVYLTPGISAFVGGDIVAGLYALRMLPAFADAGGERMQVGETGRTQDERADAAASAGRVRFLVDLGTNGEIALTDERRMLVTATAAGPAFEGGAESALFGTDRIALAASFLRRGILDETGLLAEPYFSEGVPVETGRIPLFVKPGQSCRMKKEDIRALQ
ncbi:MAG: ASKHA domain-containing protein, partial [Bacteroidales bacterium]|nr:ASKHA domain-containing protein [Bacteroidales bacterium]